MGDGDTSAVLAIATALTSRLAAVLRKVAQDRLRRSAAGVKARLKPAIRSAAPGLAWMARASAGTLYPMPYLSVMDRRRPGCAGTGRRRPPKKNERIENGRKSVLRNLAPPNQGSDVKAETKHKTPLRAILGLCSAVRLASVG
jgi:hypothetical protein